MYSTHMSISVSRKSLFNLSFKNIDTITVITTWFYANDSSMYVPCHTKAKAAYRLASPYLRQSDSARAIFMATADLSHTFAICWNLVMGHCFMGTVFINICSYMLKRCVSVVYDLQ